MDRTRELIEFFLKSRISKLLAMSVKLFNAIFHFFIHDNCKHSLFMNLTFVFTQSVSRREDLITGVTWKRYPFQMVILDVMSYVD